MSNNPAISRTVLDRRQLTRVGFRRPIAHAVAARSSASINNSLEPGERGMPVASHPLGGAPDGGVVVTVKVTFAAELPGVTEFGEAEQVASEGAPVQVKFTAWLKPPSPPMLSVYVADCPGETVAVVVEPEAGANEKSCPVPLRATVWGFWTALSAMLRAPVRGPPAVGLKVTETVHPAPALMLLAQVLVSEKSPLTVIPEIVSGALPVLFTVTV
jgi:hypothetical protein